MGTHYCRYCNALKAVRSRRRGPAERLISVFGYYPYRCGHCKRRFVLFSPGPVRIVVGLGMAACLALSFSIMALYFRDKAAEKAAQQALAANPISSPRPALTPRTGRRVLTNDDVIELVRSGVPMDRLTAQITYSRSSFDLSSKSKFAELRKAGVPESIITIMLRSSEPLIASPRASLSSTVRPPTISE